MFLTSELVSLFSNANAAVQAPCNAANCTEMGIEADIFPARGSFYVATKDKTPYCSKWTFWTAWHLVKGVIYMLPS